MGRGGGSALLYRGGYGYLENDLRGEAELRYRLSDCD